MGPRVPVAAGPAPQPTPRGSRARWIIAALLIVAIAAGVGVFVLTRPAATPPATTANKVVIYEPPDKPGSNPFTPPATVIRASSSPTPSVEASPIASATPSPASSASASPSSSTPAGTPLPQGTFGGSGSNTVCDREKLLQYLHGDPARLRVWASVRGIDISQVDQYVRALTPATLTKDLRVTNHSFVNGDAQAYQSILPAGTAVLLDANGQVVTRCLCGNPLTGAVPVGQAVCQGCPTSGYTPPPILPPAVSPAAAIEPNPPPVLTPPTATTPTPSPSASPTPSPTPSPAAATNLATKATASASSQFSPAYPPSRAVDGDPTTSWFSSGPNPATGTSTLTIVLAQPSTVTRIEFVGNEHDADANTRTGFGYGRWTIDLIDANNNVLHTVNSVAPATSDQSSDFASVAGVVKVLFTGYQSQASNCGGLGELRVIGS
jgi:hypothetical protein